MFLFQPQNIVTNDKKPFVKRHVLTQNPLVFRGSNSEGRHRLLCPLKSKNKVFSKIKLLLSLGRLKTRSDLQCSSSALNKIARYENVKKTKCRLLTMFQFSPRCLNLVI